MQSHALIRLELMNLLNVNRQTAGGVQPPRAHVTLEVLGLLMLHQNCVVRSVFSVRGRKWATDPSHLRTPAHSTSTTGE